MNCSLLDAEAFSMREESELAGYAMRCRASKGRAHPEPPSRYRTVFQRDRDRVVHSTAFRRLEYKTQVFVNHEGDHYRTRLTHTLEVSQISRSIARVLRLNEDLVEAISLSHDLGHSPFGHAGEQALDELMRGHGGFNHNEQSLRVVDFLERRYPDFPGLNLTFEVRESLVKHGERWRAEAAGEFDPELMPLLEAQLVDVADALAYASHDVDDGLRSSFIALEELREVAIWREAEAAVSEGRRPMAEKVSSSRAVARLIDLQVTDLIEATRARIEEGGIDTVEKVRRRDGRLVDFSPRMRDMRRELQDFLATRLYNHYRTLKMAEKAKRFVREIFREYLRNPKQLPPEFQARVPEEGAERVICDYIAGMTDRYCQDEYKRLFHPFERI